MAKHKYEQGTIARLCIKVSFILAGVTLCSVLTANRIARPADLNVRFTCRIQRNKVGMDRLNPHYELYVQNLVTNEVQWLFTAYKKRKSQTSYYSIKGSATTRSTNSHQQNSAEQITIAKVRYVRGPVAAVTDIGGVLIVCMISFARSNFLGTNFSIYSNGRNPSSSPQEYSDSNRESDIREELAAVVYVSMHL